MCQHSSKTVNHLLLHCSVASDLWNMFLSISRVSWVVPRNVKDTMESWSLWVVDRAIKKIWQMIPACIVWSIWMERNRRCFDGISTPNTALKSNCLMFLFSWSNLTPVNNVIPLVDFISSLSLANSHTFCTVREMTQCYICRFLHLGAFPNFLCTVFSIFLMPVNITITSSKKKS